jgi:hypothetical protein
MGLQESKMNKVATEKPAKESQVSTPEPANKILFALHEVMSKVGYVQKKDRNDFQHYNYAGEAALLETLRPAMVEAGLILIPSGTERAEIDQYGITNVTVEYTLAHKDGEVWPDKIRAYGAGGDKNKNGVGDKGLYKALTGANKYLLFKLFQIETGDDPEIPNAQDKGDVKDEAPAHITPAQLKELNALIRETATDVPAFCKHFKWNSLKEIPSDHFKQAKHALETKKARRGTKK